MRAGAHAIEAKRAVKVSRFARQKEVHFATALTFVSAQTVMCFAAGTNIRLANFDFERRDQRRHKLELTDRANIFAEACAAEQGVNNKRYEKIIYDQPRRPDWLVP